MAITAFQSGVLKLLAARRRQMGESYVAGGVALNQLLHAPRKSHDIDHQIQQTARRMVEVLPHEEAGACVVTLSEQLFTGGTDELGLAMKENRLLYHRGRIGGSFPSVNAD